VIERRRDHEPQKARVGFHEDFTRIVFPETGAKICREADAVAMGIVFAHENVRTGYASIFSRTDSPPAGFGAAASLASRNGHPGWLAQP
jgi:hypothetical protein